jgi:small membrane protein
MIFKYIFIGIFFVAFFYAALRPFSSLISKIFIMIGSLLGILSLIGEKYAQSLANFLGIGRAADLFLYLSLVTIFLFISYTVNRLDSSNKRISKLTKEIALNNAHKEFKKNDN